MKKTPLLIGILLVLVGALLLAMQFVPDLQKWVQWPMILIAAGLIFLVGAITSGNGDLAIPGVICAGIGGISMYQLFEIGYGSWDYLWTLIPGFVGLGILLANLINRSSMDRSGVILILISAFAFVAFYAVNRFEQLSSDMIWPFALIFVGVLIVFNNITRKRVTPKIEDEG